MKAICIYLKKVSRSVDKIWSHLDGSNYFLFSEALIGTTTWTKHYCMYRRETKEFVMIPYNQMTGKFVSYHHFTFSIRV